MSSDSGELLLLRQAQTFCVFSAQPKASSRVSGTYCPILPVAESGTQADFQEQLTPAQGNLSSRELGYYPDIHRSLASLTVPWVV